MLTGALRPGFTLSTPQPLPCHIAGKGINNDRRQQLFHWKNGDNNG
ncbi:hypothetical protein [Mangrovibacter yixingensis]|nr:hypothetical protein [Mangrovibacter yixingensis]